MAQRKPYDSNTSYGRKKIREQAQKYYEELPPEDKSTHNLLATVIMVIICIIMFLILGADGFLKWGTR